MDVRKVMIIRHAEKPPKHRPLPHGVDVDGQRDDDDLAPRGWQRAGALVGLFAPVDGSAPVPPIERPAAAFAAGTSAASTSVRTRSTIAATAAAARIPVQVLGAPGQEQQAAEAILADGAEVALVCWEHKRISDLVSGISRGAAALPAWDKTRFDVTIVLTRRPGGWDIEQVPQLLLPDDDKRADVSARNPAITIYEREDP